MSRKSKHEAPRRWLDHPRSEEVAALLRPLQDKPPPAAMERVWQRLQRQPEPKRGLGRSLALGVAATAALALFVVFSMHRGQQGAPPAEPAIAARATYVQGRVAVDPAEWLPGEDHTAPRLLNVGDPIAVGARVAAQQGRAVLRMGQRAGLLLKRQANLLFSGPANPQDADKPRLVSGTVLVVVDPSLHGPPFTIRAGPYQIRVVGTAFQLHLTPQRQLSVEVLRGIVEIEGPQTRLRLAAGERFPSEGSSAHEVAAGDVQLLRRALPELAGELTLSQPALAAETETADDGEPSELPAAGVDDATARSSKRARPRQTRRRRLTSERATKPATKPGSHPVDEEKRRYDAAVTERDREKAIALFDQIAQGGGPRAEVATYQAARLATMLSSRDGIARFERYLARYPGGAFDTEARVSLIEARLAGGDLDRALDDVEAFLRERPSSERRFEVRFLRAEIRRQRDGNCKAALPDYRAALASTARERWREDALFMRAWCLAHEGRRESAHELFQRYLRRYPEGRHADRARRALGENATR